MTDHALNPTNPFPARPSTLRIWLQAVRIFSFTASAIPIFVAGAMALVDRVFDPVLFLAMLIASIVCQAYGSSVRSLCRLLLLH